MYPFSRLKDSLTVFIIYFFCSYLPIATFKWALAVVISKSNSHEK